RHDEQHYSNRSYHRRERLHESAPPVVRLQSSGKWLRHSLARCAEASGDIIGRNGIVFPSHRRCNCARFVLCLWCLNSQTGRRRVVSAASHSVAVVYVSAGPSVAACARRALWDPNNEQALKKCSRILFRKVLKRTILVVLAKKRARSL